MGSYISAIIRSPNSTPHSKALKPPLEYSAIPSPTGHSETPMSQLLVPIRPLLLLCHFWGKGLLSRLGPWDSAAPCAPDSHQSLQIFPERVAWLPPAGGETCLLPFAPLTPLGGHISSLALSVPNPHPRKSKGVTGMKAFCFLLCKIQKGGNSGGPGCLLEITGRTNTAARRPKLYSQTRPAVEGIRNC